MSITFVSLFSGIGGFEVGLERACAEAGLPRPECVAYAETDRFSAACYAHHFPDHVNAGDVRDVVPVARRQLRGRRLDVLFGGSPCQDFSLMKTERLGLEGPKSSLFWAFAEAVRELRPRHVVLENVATVPREAREVMTEALGGHEPVEICASGFGPQRRSRLFWCSFPVEPPPGPCPATFADALVPLPVARTLRHSDVAERWLRKPFHRGRTRLEAFGHRSDWPKSRALVASMANGLPNNLLVDCREDPPLLRKFAQVELERLQGFPEGWTATLSRSRATRALGNAVHAGVARHVFTAYLAARSRPGAARSGRSR